jgi:hypothetical protein
MASGRFEKTAEHSFDKGFQWRGTGIHFGAQNGALPASDQKLGLFITVAVIRELSQIAGFLETDNKTLFPAFEYLIQPRPEGFVVG